MIGTTIAIGGSAASALSLVGGIYHGKALKKLLAGYVETNIRIQRIEEKLLYAPDINTVRQIEKDNRQTLNEVKAVRDMMQSLSSAFRGEVLATSPIRTPESMRTAISSNPEDVFFYISPIGRPAEVHGEGLVPFLFESNGQHYIGWQKRGIIASLFGVEILHPESLESHGKYEQPSGIMTLSVDKSDRIYRETVTGGVMLEIIRVECGDCSQETIRFTQYSVFDFSCDGCGKSFGSFRL